LAVAARGGLVTTLCRDCVALTIAAARNGRCGKCGSPRQVYHATLDRVSIAHVDCDAFDATVEERDRPGLADRPVIICGGFPWCRARLLIRCGALWRAFGNTDVNRPVASEACFRRADSRSHNGHSACASPSASATSCPRVVSAEIECAGARASRRDHPRRARDDRAARRPGRSGRRAGRSA